MKTYTPDELRTMTNSELNAVVARVVMGWRPSKVRSWVWVGCHDSYTGFNDCDWFPATAWRYCGRVVERMLKRGALMTLGANAAGFDLVGNHMGGIKNSPCRAICEAAVLATHVWRAGKRKGK